MTKALTLTQPWASLVATGVKTIETRTWSTSYRGPLLIHAAKGMDRLAIAAAADMRRDGILTTRLPDLPRGVIVAVAQLVDVMPTTYFLGRVEPVELEVGNFDEGRFGWQLADVRSLLHEPVPWRGSLGLWEGPDL